MWQNFLNYFLPLIIMIFFTIIAIALCIIIKRKFGKKLNTKSNIETTKSINLVLKEPYCSEKEMRFLEAIHKALPKDFISFPKVSMTNIVTPKDNLVGFNHILDKHVDILVCLRCKMIPVLVIDLVDISPIQQQLKQMDPFVIQSLQNVKLNVLKIQIQENYDIKNLKEKIFNVLPPKILLNLKNDLINHK